MKDAYLITGASGFIGSCLTRKLVSENKDVHVILRSDPKKSWRLKDILRKIHVHEIDLLDKDLGKLIKKINPTYALHLAAYGSLPKEDNLDKMLKTNVLGTANLINALKLTDFKLLINTGSSAEYQSKNSKLKESDPTSPTNDYGVSKTAQTLLSQKEARENNLPIITFRLFSPYGEYEAKSRLIPYTIINALNNKNVSLSNPKFVRDFAYIDDVLDLYIKACKSKILPGEIYNVGSSHQENIKTVVSLILKITKSKSKPLWGENQKQTRQIEPIVWEANIEKAVKAFGWKPKYDLEKGLIKTVDWFSKNQNLYV